MPDEYWAAYREVTNARKADRRLASNRTAAEAMRVAAGNGYQLRQVAEDSWQLRSPAGWLLNVYPTTQRLYANPTREPKPPYLRPRLPKQRAWTVLDVVRVAIATDEATTGDVPE